ncbi:MAG: cation-translocating P-type ATPase, partial [Comamonadaceae bacterium]
LEASSLRVLEASLTGESEAVHKNPATLADPGALGDRLDMVFKGTAVAQGVGRAVVTATGMHTEMGAIAGMLDATVEAPTPLAIEVARIGRVLGIAVVVIAAVVVTTILLATEQPGAADVVAVLLLGVSLAVAAVPEGLPAILSVVLAMGVQRMAKHKAIVKNLSSVETLGAASVICTDKTGTLTRAEMTVERVVTASGTTRITGAGYAPTGRVEHEGAELQPGPLREEQIVVLAGGSLAGDARLHQGEGGAWSIHGDPTEAAFLVAERKMGLTAQRKSRFERVAEIPFTSDRKMMSTVERDHAHGDQLMLVAKGAPGVLLSHCRHVRIGMDMKALDAAMRKRILADVDALSDAALRTLAVAYRPLTAQE